MPKLKQLERTTEKRTETVEESIPTTTDSAELLAETDALLDEIDRVLEIETTVTDVTTDEPEKQPLTLSQLMRAGSEMSEQAIGAWERDGATCALQATYEAAKANGLI